MIILNTSNAPALSVTVVATCFGSLESAKASGKSSAKTIHTMQPAANPSENGNIGLNVSTNMNAGTANNGCGRLVITHHNAHCHGFTPLVASTFATAKPSGTLCAPIASVTNLPCLAPPAPLNDTPTPQPSPNACAAMIPTIISVFRASAPRNSKKLSPSSRALSHVCALAMSTAPTTTPTATLIAPDDCPSCMRSNEAASMTPHAHALASAAKDFGIR